MIKMVIVGALALGMAGCSMSGPRAPSEMLMTNSELEAKDDRICRSYGAQPGSQAYVACRMQAQQIRYESSPDTRMAQMNVPTYGLGAQPTRVEMSCMTTRTGLVTNTNCH